MILLKGEPKTQEIISLNKNDKGVYWVRFKTGKAFPYSHRDVHILSSPQVINIEHCQVFKSGKLLKDITKIFEYTFYSQKYYRVIYSNGFINEYNGTDISVHISIMANKQSAHIFNYLKDVSAQQILTTEFGTISLRDKYEKIDFIDQETALATYLYPNNLKKLDGYKYLLFPFYSNLSQMQAVDNAFKSQISIIQGPPGTGKTQTILNIVANIVAHNKSVMIVSNNNSAVENIKEKFDKEGLGFIVAKLGKTDNSEHFIKEGQSDYPNMNQWQKESVEEAEEELKYISIKLKTIFEKQNRLAQIRQELKTLDVESEHFYKENYYVFDKSIINKHRINRISSDKLINLWVWLEANNEKDKDEKKTFSLNDYLKRVKDKILNIFLLHRILNIKIIDKIDERNILDIKALFYFIHQKELKQEIEEISTFLKDKHAQNKLERQAKLSMDLLKSKLYAKFEGGEQQREKFSADDLWKRCESVVSEYPVILSTTFSAVSCLSGYLFDYLIIDEASQVSIDSAALSLLRAKNAIIVGDTKQLPNIITNEVQEVLQKLNDDYQIDDAYNCLTNSFLRSVTKVFQSIPQVLLREHYRCTPMIIDFCNQKFYNGNLIIMTKDSSDNVPMKVIKTVEGNHSRTSNYKGRSMKFNQREVDEFKNLIDNRQDISWSDMGIITPYRGQALLFQKTFGGRIEADTIHKYQGREKDVIIMSTVDDKYNDFVDDANLINVAVSRAKKEFILITNGNYNSDKGNLRDLINYVSYNHGEIANGQIHSIFDLLYKAYTKRRMEYLKGRKNISYYDSENIAFNVILTILKRNDYMAYLEVIPHYHLNMLIKDTSLLSQDEKKFACNTLSHVDFLIGNRVSKEVVLVIEVDGFAYHNKASEQAKRDRLKDSILKKYQIPLLRLSTTGSKEVNKIEDKIKKCVGMP